MSNPLSRKSGPNRNIGRRSGGGGGDADMSMGGPDRGSGRPRGGGRGGRADGGGRSSGRGSSGGSRGSRQQAGMNDDRMGMGQSSQGGGGEPKQTLKISGFSGTRADFNTFLAQNFDGLRYVSLQEGPGGSLSVVVNKRDVAQFLKIQVLTNGLYRVELASKARRAHHRELTEQDLLHLKQLVSKRFQGQSQSLDLSGLLEELRPIRTDFHNLHLVNAVGDIIAEHCPELKTLRLDGNQIETLEAFKQLHRKAVNLVNLSLRNNLIADFDELDHLSGMRDSLTGLILQENPALYLSPVPAPPGAALPPTPQAVLSPILYHAEMANRFPNLQLLDGQPVQRPIQFVLPSVVNRRQLPARKPSFWDGELAQGAGQAFLREYFALYDSGDRSKLDRMYARQGSRFSLTLEKTIALDSGMERFAGKSRNHAPCADEDDLALLGRLKEGYIHILHALSELPASKHSDQLTVDVLSLKSPSMGPLLSIGVTGEFLEMDPPAGMPSHIFRFRRQFLLQLVPQSRQWLILNDQLHILGSRRPKPGAIMPSPLMQPQQPPQQPQLTVDDHRKIEQLVLQTRVTQQTAYQLLMQTKGNYDAAVALVQQKQAGRF